MLSDFCRFISDRNLFRREDALLAAVSGGLDSMVMAELLYRGQFHFSVAHVNFGLRGAESDSDEAMVANWCQQRNISFMSKSLPPATFQSAHKVSLQMAARYLRYSWFNELAQARNCTSILTAHHGDDQLETIIMQIVNGQETDLLTGIPVVNGLIKRPLMFTDRKRILEFATENNILWREDSSNDTDNYVRNKIRHQVIPVLKDINPGLSDTIQKGIWKTRGANEIYEMGWSLISKKLLIRDSELIKISKKQLLEFNAPDSVLYHLISQYDFGQEVCNQLLKTAMNHIGAVFLSSKYELSVDRDFLIIRAIPANDTHDFVLIPGPGEYRLKNQILSCSIQDSQIESDQEIACIDASKLDFPLIWRTWLPGDHFNPLGMDFSKKLSDFLIDLKVPRALKTGVSVVLSGNQIVWVVGLRISEKFKVSESTVSILRIKKTNILN